MINLSDRLWELIGEFAGGKHTVFAKKCGIQPSVFQNYINGRAPSAENLIRICETFNISITWILTGKGVKYLADGSEKAVMNGQIGEHPVVALRHVDVALKFKDQPRATRMNENLYDIERLSPQVFEKMDEHIAYTAETVRLTAGEQTPEDVQKKVNGQ